VTGPIGYPAGVLIRGVEGIVGPGRLTKAIGITGRLNAKVASEETGVWFSEAPILSNRRVSRSPRIGVTAASLLGLTLLLIREGFLLGGSTVVSAERSPGKVRALLIAVQNEPAVLVYGAIAFLFLVGFALLISTAKWKRWVTGHKERKNS
jgi:hypothetical protein